MQMHDQMPFVIFGFWAGTKWLRPSQGACKQQLEIKYLLNLALKERAAKEFPNWICLNWSSTLLLQVSFIKCGFQDTHIYVLCAFLGAVCKVFKVSVKEVEEAISSYVKQAPVRLKRHHKINDFAAILLPIVNEDSDGDDDEN